MNYQAKPASMLKRSMAFVLDMILLGAFMGAFLMISMGPNKEPMEASGDDAPPTIVDQWNFLTEYVPIIEYPDIYLTVSTKSIIRNYPAQTFLAWIVLPWLWFAFMEFWKGGSLGKLILGLKVKRKDYGKPSLAATTLRLVAKLISAAIIGIGFFMAFFDRKSQALHDKLANTLVTGK